MAGEHEDFDVEEWNRRFSESPSEPDGRPRLRTRGSAPFDGRDEPFGADLGDDLHLDPIAGTEAVTEQGFPAFEHNQWTVEGEIERFGAFGRGVSRSRGWKRGVAFFLLALLVAPLVLEAVQIVSRLLS